VATAKNTGNFWRISVAADDLHQESGEGTLVTFGGGVK
jgi:hypothetical protein